MKDLKSIYTKKLEKDIAQELEGMKNPIFVFMGVQDYVDMDAFMPHVVDKDTFFKNGNDKLFTKAWFSTIFTSLTQAEADENNQYTILSFPQFSYLTNYISADFFLNRVILVKDGIRSLFLIPQEEYIETSPDENIENRPDEMPVYMGEQVKRGRYYYYTARTPIENYASITLLDDYVKLDRSASDNDGMVIDVESDPFALDDFLNTCILEQKFNQRVFVKVHAKYPQDKNQERMLQAINGLVKKSGGELLELIEAEIKETFKPKKSTMELLRQYWGQDATFRTLKVYKNPDYNKTIAEISQGLIVETIIDEYENARNNRPVKDLFLTAPTGAGKSLLFQLPAFHVSANHDVTIVVSPLIALMEDQVAQLRAERGYKKAVCLNSNLSLIDRDRLINDCKAGKIDILYMSPELLLSYDISFFIGNRKLGLLVIDEAHLITTWGRDFRVDYWFLGQHINKIRKYKDYNFPMVAVTATAIYSGENDMVFDSVNSLYMRDPHLFIGEVKRANISFAIDNHDPFNAYYDNAKVSETVSFINNIAQLGYKTIVYAPFTRHVIQISQVLDSQHKQSIAAVYYGRNDADVKNEAYRRFKTGVQKVMVCTKAFGMGVDIPDIQVVYHHAPSGMLPDYIQEIGRVARKSDSHGVAALSYAEQDQRYSRMLHGISAIKTWQIQEVLKKLYKLFLSHNSKRNMLVAVDDFGYIFDNADDLDQKVMTTLMMIEKDYLAKCRFNVLIARPKKLFVKVYARTDSVGYQRMNKDFSAYFRLFEQRDSYYYLELDLDKLWEDRFSDISFPMIKRRFYDNELLKDNQISLKPQVKFTITLDDDITKVRNKLDTLLRDLATVIQDFGSEFFKQKEFEDKLNQYIKDDKICRKISNFFLSTYSGRQIAPGVIENNAFLQRRSIRQQDQYRVFNSQYNNSFATIKRTFSALFDKVASNSSYRFVSADSEYLANYIRLGCILEYMGLGSYESNGGNNPMIAVRINDPLRIQRDGKDSKYLNRLLEKTNKRFESSSEIFDHFFLHTMDNDTRWNFIEDYFLGAPNDELFHNYPGGAKSHMDIIEFIKGNVKDGNQTDNTSSLHTAPNVFPPKVGDFYADDRMLTIDNRTMRVSKWITTDPMALHKAMVEYGLRIQTDSFKTLMSKLRSNHFAYYRDAMGLRIHIDDFNGTMAKVIYEQDPVKFYRWWKKKDNINKVSMPKAQLIQLLLKVQELSPQSLLKQHKDMLKSKDE